MRRLHALWAVAGAAGLLTGAITPSVAGSTGLPVTGATNTQTVTLITGDTVTLTTAADGKSAVDVRRGTGRESATFVSSEKDGEVSVLPADAIPLLKAGRLDPALFNVTQLVKQGYADSKTGATPVIATYEKGSATPDGARRMLKLPAIDGAALSARKSTTFWADIAPALGTDPTAKAARQLGEGIDKIWLDGKVKASLDASVAQIGAPEVWRAGNDGKGVKVAVLDTGVDTGHPDLAGKLTQTRSFVPTEAVRDGHGHGTHVASTIVGSGAASDGRRKGVAPGAELLVGKVLDNAGNGQSSWIIAGMEWAAHSGAKIVSMSLGGDASGPSDVLSETVDELSASTGTLFVIAAGNSGPSAQTVATPAIADSALTVGSVDKSDRLASSSSRGPRIGDYAIKPEIYEAGLLREEPSRLIEVASGEGAIAARLEEMYARAEHEVCLFDTPPYFAPPAPQLDLQADLLSRGIASRGIYASAALEDPAVLSRTLKMVELGERARVSPSVPVKLLVVDGCRAMLPLTSSAAGGYCTVVVWHSVVTEALQKLFEMAWQQATPLGQPVGEGELPEGERTLIRLLAAGMKDEAVARHLGVSLRTLRRRVSELQERLGAASRFQLGVRASQRGWL